MNLHLICNFSYVAGESAESVYFTKLPCHVSLKISCVHCIYKLETKFVNNVFNAMKVIMRSKFVKYI